MHLGAMFVRAIFIVSRSRIYQTPSRRNLINLAIVTSSQSHIKSHYYGLRASETVRFLPGKIKQDYFCHSLRADNAVRSSRRTRSTVPHLTPRLRLRPAYRWIATIVVRRIPKALCPTSAFSRRQKLFREAATSCRRTVRGINPTDPPPTTPIVAISLRCLTR